MPFDFAALKAVVRKTVHSTLAIDATYKDDSLPQPRALRIRWHNKMSQHGDLGTDGYSTYIDSVNRVIFDRDELVALGIVIDRGGLLTVTTPGYDNAKLFIDSRDELAGPTEEIWLVAKG